MRPAVIYGSLAAALVLTGLALPVVLPAERYEYDVERDIDSVSAPEPPEPVAYEALSHAEQTVFDAALDGSGPIRRSSAVEGKHFATSWDEGGYGNSLTAVRYQGSNYTVVGAVDRPFFAVRYCGEPLLVGLGLLVGALTMIGVVYERVRRRNESA